MKIKNRFGNIKPFNLFKQQRKFGFGGSGATLICVWLN
jgi:hypothetical protein